MATIYQGPPTEGLDISGMRALIKSGAMDETRELRPMMKPLLQKGSRRRRPSMNEKAWWAVLTVGLSAVFVAVIWFATVGVYSWLRAHGG